MDDFPDLDALFAKFDNVFLLEGVSLGELKTTLRGTVLMINHNIRCMVYSWF